jgi:hypothetical protein
MKTVRFSSGIAQAHGAEAVHALCLIAITQRAGRVAMVGAVPQGQSRHSPFGISAIAAVAIFAVTDQLLVSMCEEKCVDGACDCHGRELVRVAMHSAYGGMRGTEGVELRVL